MEKIDQILESLYDGVIEPMEAKEQILDLFARKNKRLLVIKKLNRIIPGILILLVLTWYTHRQQVNSR